MSSRSFTIFRDTPTTNEATCHRTVSASAGTGPLSVKTLNTNHGSAPSTNIEKENVHPLTGERPDTGSYSKKRKTSVLAAKSLIPLASKKQKESLNTQLTIDMKKRKPTASISKAKGSAKDVKTLSSKKSSKRLARKKSFLPKVVEEEELSKQNRRISQAEIDSRCYELTVQPLADLSKAYEQEPSVEAFEGGEVKGEVKEKYRPMPIKAASVEPEIRDYFSSPPQSAALPLGRLYTPPLEFEEHCFSTPERRKIYSAFTFASPSASGKRFSKTRASSLPLLDLQ